MIAELDTSRNYKKFYVPGEGEIDKATSERKWYSFDRQGSVVHTVSEQGYILEWLYYDAYGNRIFQTGSPGPFRYNGKSGYFHDKDVDMDLLQARYYIPMIGRFMQADPIGQAGGLNTYAYCLNNPFVYVDPSGEDALDDAASFFAGWGDTLTLGGTWHLRSAMGVNGAVDGNSGMYSAGFWAGTANSLAFGYAGGAKTLAGRSSYLRAGVQGAGAHTLQRLP